MKETELGGRGSQHLDLTYEDGILETVRWVFQGGDHIILTRAPGGLVQAAIHQTKINGGLS